MKTLLALSFITYSRVVSGGACSEPSTPHVRGGNGSESGRGGGGGNPGEQLPNRDASTPTARPSMFDNIREKLGCAKTYNEYVGQPDKTQPLKLFSLEPESNKQNQDKDLERLFLYQILQQAEVGSLSDLEKNCKLGKWHYANPDQKPEDAAEGATLADRTQKQEEYQTWLKVLQPTLDEDKVFYDNYNNPIAFPTAPTRLHEANVDNLYYCYRMVKKEETLVVDGPNLIGYSSIRTSTVGAELELCGSKTPNNNDGVIAEVICPDARRDMLRRIDKTVFDAHVEGIRTVFNRRMELINEEQAPSMEINGSFSVRAEALISKRKTCLMTQTFKDPNMAASTIFPVAACKCSAIDSSVFGGRQLDMKQFQCKWGLENHMLSSENVRPCLAAQNSIEVYKDFSAAAAFYAPASRT